MSDLTYENLVNDLVATVPEIREAYEEDQALHGQDYLPHVTFGDVLNPYIVGLLQSDEKQEEILQRIFAFLERMAQQDDLRVQEVLGVTVCEHLSGQGPELLAEARRYMGEETRQISHEIAVGWGHEPPYEDDPPKIKAMAPPERTTDGRAPSG